MSQAPDIKRYLPKHYMREYPKFVRFLELTFEFLYRDQNVSPSYFLKLVNGQAHTQAELEDKVERLSQGSARDQMNFTTKPREEWEIDFGGYYMEFGDGQLLQFSGNNPKEMEKMLADRGFDNFFSEFSGGIRSIDEIRFFRLMKDLKSFAGSSKIIEIFFSWLHEGDIEVEYPREKIATLDNSMVLDGENSLRDDAFYSEYSYLVKVFGQPKVYRPEKFYEMYLKHFHPSGFGFYLQDSYPLFVKPFDFPVLMPSGIPGSYYGLTTPLEILEDDRLNIRIFLADSFENDLSGPIAPGFEFDGNAFQFDDTVFRLEMDGVEIESGIQVLKDNQFHQLVLKYLQPTTIENFLSPGDDVNLTGKMPISRIQHIRADKQLVDFRLNTQAKNGIASAHNGFNMLSQPKGVYKLEEGDGEIIYVSDDLEAGKTYLAFVNTSNAEGDFYFSNVKGGGASADVIGFESVSSGLRRFVNEILPNAQDSNGDAPEGSIYDPPFTEDERFSTSAGNFWALLKPDELRTFAVSPDENTSKGFLQVVVWEVPDNVLTFERSSPEFENTGVWVTQPQQPEDDDYYRLFVNVNIMELLAERFEFQLDEKIPDIFGLGLTDDTLSQFQTLNDDMTDFLKNILPGRMRDDT